LPRPFRARLSTIRGLGVALVVCGFALFPVVLHYSSKAYSRTPFDGDIRIRGSAVCTDNEMVNATRTTADGVVLISAQRSYCSFTLDQAISDVACAVAIFFGVLVLTKIATRYDQAIDDACQTAQDYSVLVEDPPTDAVDPDEW
jgi:hypothetical protein